MPIATEPIYRIAHTAASLWQCQPDSLSYCGESTNYVFCGLRSSEQIYFRIIDARHRSYDQIAAELDFICYLLAQNLPVCRPLASQQDNLIEQIELDNQRYFISAFAELIGTKFEFNQLPTAIEHFSQRGRVIAALHNQARKYQPKTAVSRLQWQEDRLWQDIDDLLPRSEQIIWAEYDRLMTWLSGLNQNQCNYGLIHGDLGTVNLLCDGEQIKLFDFDDCCYHWFIYDLAITIYPQGLRSGAIKLAQALLASYQADIDIDCTLEQLIWFCRMRQLYMFLHYFSQWRDSELTARQIEWLNQKRKNIAQGYSFSQ